MIEADKKKEEKYLSREGKQSNCGWLVRVDRRKRRDDSNTMTDRDITMMINKIRDSTNYTSPHVSDTVTELIKQRDTALIALSYTFFKRVSENLSLKVKDISNDSHKLTVKYQIEKKSKHYRSCVCGENNAKASVFCKTCGANISKNKIIEIHVAGEPEFKTKTKNLKYPYTKYVVDWVNTMKNGALVTGEKVESDALVTSESWLFPSYSFFGNCWNVNSKKHLSIARFNQILQKLDTSLSSHLFRYGKTENLLRAGYSKIEISNIGDWSSEKIVETYAKRKNITMEELRFSDDLFV